MVPTRLWVSHVTNYLMCPTLLCRLNRLVTTLNYCIQAKVNENATHYVQVLSNDLYYLTGPQADIDYIYACGTQLYVFSSDESFTGK